jgi:ribose/xylose/arabinose/galactoside ABC-type transport system permease subunit
VLFSTLNGFTLVGITALGVGVTMIAGELDLSVGSMAAVAAVLTIQLESIGLFGAIAPLPLPPPRLAQSRVG